MSKKKTVTPPDMSEPGNSDDLDDPMDARDPLRDRRGRLKGGGPSLNPSGRPKSLAEFREALTEHVPTALKVLVDIMGDPMAQHKDRIAAVREVLDRKFGKASQSVELTGKDGGPLEHADKTPALTSEQRGRRIVELLNTVAALAGKEEAAEKTDEGSSGDGK